MNHKTELHTTLKPSDIKKIKDKYGNGKINDGLEKLLEIAEAKEHDTKEVLLRLAEKIMQDYGN